MGVIINKSSVKSVESGEAIYTLRTGERAKVTAVWTMIENNPQEHCILIFTRLFQCYPKYQRYFTPGEVTHFALDARMNKTFRKIIETLTSLILDYPDRKRLREQLLSYLAMIHKDMKLEMIDFKNLYAIILDYLLDKFPDLMTPACINAYDLYLNSIAMRLLVLIEKLQNADIFAEPRTPKFCKWIKLRGKQDFLYGRPRQYWIEKERYWNARFESWQRMEIRMNLGLKENSENGKAKNESMIQTTAVIMESQSRGWKPEDHTSSKNDGEDAGNELPAKSRNTLMKSSAAREQRTPTIVSSRPRRRSISYETHGQHEKSYKKDNVQM